MSPSPRRLGGATRLVIVLTLLNTVNYMDRALVAVLAQPIKTDLALTDVELGLLSGFAFALVYSLLALPLSRVIDTGRHRLVILASTAVWSIMTTLGAFANSFWSLAAMRVGVALGEAGLHPASHSLISLRLPLLTRGKALAIFSLGLPLGVGAGSIFGGWLSDDHGWRQAFLVLGPVGLLLLPVIWWAIPATREPPEADEIAAEPHEKIRLLPAIRILWTQRVFRYLFCGQAILSMFGFALTSFIGAFFMRIHGWSALETGSFIAASNGIGSLGLLAGGALFDAGNKRWPRHAMLPVVVALVISGLAAPIGWLSPHAAISVIFATLATLFYLFGAVPTIAMAQSITAPHLRATSSALMTLSASLIGATLGPLFAGAISDALTSSFGARALAWSLSAMSIGQLGSAYFYWKAGRLFAAEQAA